MTSVRKFVTVTEDVERELGEPVAAAGSKAAVAAVLRNPWYGREIVDDLGAEVASVAPKLASEMAERLIVALGGTTANSGNPASSGNPAISGNEAVSAFGKAALIGTGGELEHGAAFIHTPYFGNVLREMTGGTEVIVFADDRGPAGTSLSVPLWHKTASTTRSHYQSMQIRVPDAPADDEIVIIAAAASGPRPNARSGDRSTDPAVRLSDVELT